ncbi:hypothetical protein Dalk_2880 [Desulfatibacillum aliphaticivorans]|uniref:Uncharacterized protein n=1 Tax=Desulfatibacillum aliphaticivorans TaxID=218208 RepID=B8FBC6_DESAL|nr:hypothetical protein [Desulfatibacillum aliphaticivorans]ACL04570.1 hypothetical protein Dalk_2880 [Desulfatibacillum aliphaticivorans]
MLTGAIAAGVGEYVGGAGYFGDDFGPQLIGRSTVGALTGGVTSVIYGQDFFDGFMQGAKTAAIGFMCNHALHDIGNGVTKAMVEGTKAAGKALWETGKALLTNEDLHKGVMDGGMRAGGIVLGTKAFVSVKAVTIAWGTGAIATPALSFSRNGNNVFRIIDRANKWGFRIDRPHGGHMAKGTLNYIKRNWKHPHLWKW